MSITILQSKQPEVIKLHSIDSSYRGVLSYKFLAAAQSLGVLRVISLNFVKKYEALFKIINDAIYNYITLLKVRKTFGEQYTYLNLYNSQDYQFEGTPLAKERRVLLFVLNTFGFSIIKLLFKKLYTEILEDCKSNHEGKTWRIAISVFPQFDDLVEKVKKFVLMLFLIRGDYFSIYQRLLKIRFIYLRYFKQTIINYKRQGYLMLVQGLVQIFATIFTVYKISEVQKRREESYNSHKVEMGGRQQQIQQTICIICSSQITNKSVTPCGHVFCWQCIVKAVQIRPQCPTCRMKCLPSRIIQLKNY